MLDRLRDARAKDGLAAWERRTAVPLLVLALLFLAVLLLPPLVRLTAAQRAALDAAGVLVWGVFAVDYAARLYLAPRRWQFVRSHPLDLLVLALPMLRPLRAARVLRVLRLLRLAQVGALLASAHHRARSLHVRVTGYVTCAVAVIVVVAAAAVLEAERDAADANIGSLGDALWWSIVTVATVGYGDRFPVTGAGRAVGVGLMVFGIALLGVVSAGVAAWFVSRLGQAEEAEARTAVALADVLDEVRALRAEVAQLRGAGAVPQPREPHAPADAAAQTPRT